MKVSVIRIGKSKGIRSNKIVLDKYLIADEVGHILEEGTNMIKPIVKPRYNWDKAFSEMRKRGDDALLL